MLISLPIVTTPTATNVVEDVVTRPIYDKHDTYEDKDLVQYDPLGGTDYDIYGVFNGVDEHSHPTQRLVYYSKTAPNAPFDTTNYSKASRAGEITYTIEGVSAFDTVAFGHILADTITVNFKDANGVIMFAIIDHELNNKIDEHGRHPRTAVNQILYSPNDMPVGSTVDIIAKRAVGDVEIGTIVLGLSLNAGFTHLVFTNEFRDYSPQEKDQWGNITYIEGVKVNVHSGNVDVPITNYDYMNRMMLYIGGKTVILNGYGKKVNVAPKDIEGTLYATMMIARIKNFRLQTALKDLRLADMASYSFTAEEIV